MKPTLCSRCKKNVAVVFITRLDPNGQNSHNEGLCLKCARELNIRPVTDMIEKMGLSDEELEGLTNEMMSAFDGTESMQDLIGNITESLRDVAGERDDDEDEEEGRTATFPFLNRLMGNMNGQEEKKDETPAPSAPQGGKDKAQGRAEKPERKARTKRKFLENHCISLTRKAAEGKLDKMIGRDQELERVIQILNRRQKNNPCLIGEPGVGKTAIAEGLAMKIFQGDVPYKLKDKEVYLLDLTSLVAGTQFRGQFESRMKGLIEEIKKLGNIILVIDEVHNLVGAGDAEGSMNAANILKPALSRGEIQVIGATTLVEYRKYIEKDSALERRFQPVIVNEPSIEDAVEIIKGVVEETRPDVVLVIDALAARNTRRLSRTIQISDTGINPGSGVGNHRNGINKEALGVPVISIGVPTVVDAATIVGDTMEEMVETLDSSGKVRGFGGALGTLNRVEKQQMIRELLSPHLNTMYVTPKDIDETVKRISFTISEGINIALGGMA